MIEERTGWRVVALLATVLALIASATIASAQDIRDRYQQNQEELETARTGLDVVEAQVAQAHAALTAVDGQLRAAAADLRALESRLASAQQTEAQARARTEEVTTQLRAETDRLHAAQADLERREDVFDRRVAATFKYGTATYADALVGAKTFTEFLNSYYYVRSALDYEDELISGVTALVREIRERRAEVDRLREEALVHQRAAEEARSEVEGITEDQRTLTASIAADRAERERLATELRAAQREYEGLVAALEAESASLAEELRRSQWRAGAPGAGELVWPSDGRVTSGFGWRTHPIFGSRRMHTGIDIGGSTGQAVVAASEGLVIHAGHRGGYGNAVVIDHGGGLATLYAHLSAIGVSQGQVVSPAQTVGRVGCTGYCTGPHLHFEVRVNGEPQDPMRWY